MSNYEKKPINYNIPINGKTISNTSGVKESFNYSIISEKLNNSYKIKNEDNKISPKKARIFTINKYNNSDKNVNINSSRELNAKNLSKISSNGNIRENMNNNKIASLISLEKIISYRIKKVYSFRFGDLVAYYLFCHWARVSNLKIKYEDYNKIQTAMNTILDIKRILHKLEEYDTLKMVLFNNEQLALLNFINKYKLSSSESRNKFTDDKKMLENEEYLRKLVNELLIKVNNSEKENLDSTTFKLVNYLDQHIFEEFSN